MKWKSKTDLSKPSLRTLAFVLRHKELWPVGFEWDFNTCDTCAMGLAYELWQLGDFPDSYGMAKHFHISEQTSANLFLHQGEPVSVITPEMIADRLDALATKPAR